MIRSLSLLTFALILALLAVGCGVSDVEVTAAIEREAYERKTNMPPAERMFPMQHPVGCPVIQKCDARGCKARFTCAADLTARGG